MDDGDGDRRKILVKPLRHSPKKVRTTRITRTDVQRVTKHEPTYMARIDPQARKNYEKELVRIETELETTENPVRQKELEQQRDFIERELRTSKGFRGRPRRVGPAPHEEKARKRVGNAINRARELIAMSMPKCGQHIEECVGADKWRVQSIAHYCRSPLDHDDRLDDGLAKLSQRSSK